MPWAAMDLGSNTFHLLVAECGQDGELKKLGAYKEVLRLGSSLDARGALPPAVLGRALDAVGTMLAYARFFRARPLIAGTSALRSATNGELFRTLVRQRFAQDVELLSGGAEATLAYRGARSGLVELPERVAVVDLGGGSLELAVGGPGAPESTATLPLGFLRLGRGPSQADLRAEVARSARDVVASVRELAPEACVASGGTARALAKILGPSARAEGRPVYRDELASLARELYHADAGRLVDLGVEPSRRETLGAGATILSAFVDALGAPSIRISPAGLREGLVLRAAQAESAGTDRGLPSSSTATSTKRPRVPSRRAPVSRSSA